MRSEPDLRPTMRKHSEKHWSFPKVVRADHLVFYHMEKWEEAQPGVFGLQEPDPERHPETPSERVDLILVPGVGFDPKTKGRIGHGKAYYDKFLSPLTQLQKPPVLVGIAFAAQFIDVPIESHDIPMDCLLTENGWL